MTAELPIIGLVFPGVKLAVEGLGAFTNQQRWAIREERDGGKCQFPPHLNGHAKECGGRLEVHHILGQRYCRHFKIDPDFPANAITICENAHSKVIHPDMQTARREYGMNKESYHKAFEARDELLKEGKIYWNDEHDRSMTAVAIRNTQRAESNGWQFPQKKT